MVTDGSGQPAQPFGFGAAHFAFKPLGVERLHPALAVE
jgi:hypothetical protein